MRALFSVPFRTPFFIRPEETFGQLVVIEGSVSADGEALLSIAAIFTTPSESLLLVLLLLRLCLSEKVCLFMSCKVCSGCDRLVLAENLVRVHLVQFVRLSSGSR